MCARRFLLAVLILTLVAVAAGFAIFQWGGSVLLKQATPKGHFEATQGGSGPDYRKLDTWIARPEIRANPAQWRPPGFPARAPLKVATFYIHPTTYLERDRWNAPLHPAGDTELRTRLFVQSQASALGDLTTVWAPRYRQAAFGAFLLKSADAEKALDLAYSDVSAAFDEFLRQIPAPEPIILAGHSQGALHLMRLLHDRHAELKNRLIAAYVAGWPISTTADLPALGFPACRDRAQPGCILSWLSFGDPPNPSFILDQWRKTDGLTGAERRSEDILCVNPLTGTQNGAAPPKSNPGTLVPTDNFRSAHIEAGKLGAHCAKGLLIVDGDVPSMGSFVLPGNNYHAYDFALFWAAIEPDALDRIHSWFE